MNVRMNERLKEVRKTLNLTLAEFGENLGITPSAVGNIEKGRRALTTQVILAVCREYNVNEEWLKDGKGDMFNIQRKQYIDEIAKNYQLDELDEIIINTYMSLPFETRKIIKDYAISFAKFYEKYDADKLKNKSDFNLNVTLKEEKEVNL